jgi:hypothetical protein
VGSFHTNALKPAMARPVTSEFISRGAFVRLDCLGIGNKPPNVAVEDNAVAAENFTCASLRFQVLADTKRQAEPTGLVECNAKGDVQAFHPPICVRQNKTGS